MPVRKIPKTYGSLSGISVSSKLNRTTSFESSLERDLLTLAEFDSNIVFYEEQPVKIEYYDSSRKLCSYTPDILIIYKNEKVSPFNKTHILGEVKYRANLFSNWKELKLKFREARRFCKKRDWLFNIFTEVEIRTAYLKNVRFLLPFKNNTSNNEISQRLLISLNCFGSTTVSQLPDEHSQTESERLQIIPIIWYLLANESISADLNSPLTMSSKIWTKQPEQADEF